MWTESDSIKDPEKARHQYGGSIRSRPWGPVPGHPEPTGWRRGIRQASSVIRKARPTATAPESVPEFVPESESESESVPGSESESGRYRRWHRRRCRGGVGLTVGLATRLARQWAPGR